MLHPIGHTPKSKALDLALDQYLLLSTANQGAGFCGPSPLTIWGNKKKKDEHRTPIIISFWHLFSFQQDNRFYSISKPHFLNAFHHYWARSLWSVFFWVEMLHMRLPCWKKELIIQVWLSSYFFILQLKCMMCRHLTTPWSDKVLALSGGVKARLHHLETYAFLLNSKPAHYRWFMRAGKDRQFLTLPRNSRALCKQNCSAFGLSDGRGLHVCVIKVTF